jgi:hypothetical protein
MAPKTAEPAREPTPATRLCGPGGRAAGSSRPFFFFRVSASDHGGSSSSVMVASGRIHCHVLQHAGRHRVSHPNRTPRRADSGNGWAPHHWHRSLTSQRLISPVDVRGSDDPLGRNGRGTFSFHPQPRAATSWVSRASGPAAKIRARRARAPSRRRVGGCFWARTLAGFEPFERRKQRVGLVRISGRVVRDDAASVRARPVPLGSDPWRGETRRCVPASPGTKPHSPSPGQQQRLTSPAASIRPSLTVPSFLTKRRDHTRGLSAGLGRKFTCKAAKRCTPCFTRSEPGLGV